MKNPLRKEASRQNKDAKKASRAEALTLAKRRSWQDMPMTRPMRKRMSVSKTTRN